MVARTKRSKSHATLARTTMNTIHNWAKGGGHNSKKNVFKRLGASQTKSTWQLLQVPENHSH